ncbi:MAG: PsiF family protein [Gallionella sp.]
MKKFIVLTCLGLAIVMSAPVMAGQQQEKMKGCSREAKNGGLKGNERKAFMRKCLKKDNALNSAATESVPAPDKARKPDK